MSHRCKTDIVIIGGGVAGLWTLNRCQQLGFNTMLLERDSLGGVQTLASQGMIHGGIKYALGGFTTPASETIAGMPAYWDECLNGTGAVDLTRIPVLSRDYYLFSDGSLTSNITSFFARKAIRSRIEKIEQPPAPFSHPDFKGHVYRLLDIVIDTTALVTKLAERGDVYRGDPEVVYDGDGIKHIKVDSQIVEAKVYIFAAGSGNERLLHSGKIASPKMQTRPLHQIMLAHPDLPEVYAHAVSLGAGDKPRMTITTHQNKNGDPVWYLGGDIAETGTSRNEETQIEFAKRELRQLFPWLNLDDARFRTLPIDRAEPAQSDHDRPDEPYATRQDNMIVCWPTKLTLVPLMAEHIISLIREQPGNVGQPQLPVVGIANPPWFDL